MTQKEIEGMHKALEDMEKDNLKQVPEDSENADTVNSSKTNAIYRDGDGEREITWKQKMRNWF